MTPFSSQPVVANLVRNAAKPFFFLGRLVETAPGHRRFSAGLYRLFARTLPANGDRAAQQDAPGAQRAGVTRLLKPVDLGISKSTLASQISKSPVVSMKPLNQG